MASPINEYKILRIIKTYFEYLKDNTSVFYTLFDTLFETLDVDTVAKNAFRDLIANDKIQYRTSYANVTAELPVVTCIMDHEIQQQKTIGDVAGEDVVENLPVEEYAVLMYGSYIIGVSTKQQLLTRLLSILIKILLEHYYITYEDNMYDMEMNFDRNSPDSYYYPNDVHYIHMIMRFYFIDSFEETASSALGGVINKIELQACEDDRETYVLPGPWAPSELILLAPNGGGTIKKDSSVDITWDSPGALASFIKIELLKNNVLVSTLSSSFEVDAGKFSWRVSPALVDGADYSIQITSTLDATKTDKSDTFFTIST